MEIVVKQKRAAAYCRVSTGMECQEGSYEIQKSYFTELLSNNPDEELVKVYADEGSGRSTQGRPEFRQMIQDCMDGKIDIIYTKSISRFSRNMLDCVTVVRRLKELGIPVIFLTARGSVDDRVRGLRMGAEDYIVKPFEVVELLARVDVVLRRYNKTDAVIEIGGLRIDTRAMQVWRGTEEISLTHKEYDLLLFFARNPGTALYRETIYEHVWGGEYSYGSKTVDLHIQRLRKKVGWENRLLAVNKVGYRLEV